MKVWHGTNQVFEEFSPLKLGFANQNEASRMAVFFSKSREVAESYARHAAKTMVPDHDTHEARVSDLLARADRAMKRGNFDLYEVLVLEAEEMESNALQAAPSGARVLLCEIEIENPLRIDGTCREVMTDMAAVLAKAKAAGHDAVIFEGIFDTPDGSGDPDDHIAAFNFAKMRILEVIPLTEDVFEKEKDDMPCP